MLIKYIMLIFLLLLSLASDAKTCKIKNLYILAFSVSGCLWNLIIYGQEGFIRSIAGFFLPILLLFSLFALKMIGAGDIKLFAAIGSIMGFRFAAYNIVYSFMAGGFIALIVISIRGNAAERVKELAAYFKSCFICFTLLDYNGFKSDKKCAFRFTFAIVPVAIIQTVIIILN